MADNTSKRRTFPTHIYDYNYKVSEGYYKPQKKYMEDSTLQRERSSPPKHRTYAERFAAEPWYGEAKGLPYRNEKSALNEPLIKLTERPFRSSSLLKEIKDYEEDNIPLDVRANRRRKRFEEEDEKLGIRPRNIRRKSLTDDSKPYHLKDGRSIEAKLKEIDYELERIIPQRRHSLTHNGDLSFPSINKSKIEIYQNGVAPSLFPSVTKPISQRFRTKFFKNDEFDDLTASKPRARRGSIGNDIKEVIRHRHYSSQHTNGEGGIEDDEDDIFNKPKTYIKKSEKIRNERRLKQSREITDGINNIVEKMRSNRINYEDGYLDKGNRRYRANTLDPVVREERKKIHSSYTYKNRKH